MVIIVVADKEWIDRTRVSGLLCVVLAVVADGCFIFGYTTGRRADLDKADRSGLGSN